MTSVSNATVSVSPTTTGLGAIITVTYTSNTQLVPADAVLVITFPAAWDISGLQVGGPGGPPGVAGYELTPGGWTNNPYPFQVQVSGQTLTIFGYRTDLNPSGVILPAATGCTIKINIAAGVPAGYFTNPAAAVYAAGDFAIANGPDGDAIAPNAAVTITSAGPTTKYWVGGTGNWSSTSHWSATSGGSSGASVPDATEVARFDSASFSGAGQTVTLDIAPSVLSMNWTGATNTPALNWGTVTTTIAKDLILISGMTCSGVPTGLTFNGAVGGTITIPVAIPLVNVKMKFMGGGTWVMGGNWATMANLQMYFEAATFTTGNFSLNVRQMYDAHTGGGTPGTVSVSLGSSAVTLHDSIDLALSGTTFAPQTSTHTWVPDIDFFNVNVKSTVTFAAVSVQQGVNTGNVVSFSGGFTVTALTLQAGSGYYPMNGVHLAALHSSGGSPASLVKITGAITATGTLSADYLRVQNSTVTGTTPATANLSLNASGNTGWVFTNPLPVPSRLASIPSIPSIPSIGGWR